MKKKSKPASKAKAAPKKKFRVVNVKVGGEQREIEAKARRYADGNISAWLRYAGRMYTPKKGEKVNLKASWAA